jgi:predicted O-linked N-acetylglucosamine transferase (SPINDLY family)
VTPTRAGPTSSIGQATANAHVAQASALLAQGDLDAAIDRLMSALGLQPDFAAALFMLAQALWMQGKLESAAERLREGLSWMPESAEAHNNLGLLYKALHRYDAAIEAFGKALAINPGLVWAHCNLGNALQAQRKSDEAIASYRRALSIDPRHVESYVNLGNVLHEQGDLEAAVATYRHALSLRPQDAQAHVNVGIALQSQGDLDAAIRSFRNALSLKPDNADAHSGLLFSINIHPAFSPTERLAAARRFGSAAMARARPFSSWTVGPIEPGRAAPLRIGCISGDLRAHPVGFFMESVLEHIDRARFEVVAYPTLAQEDDLTARIKTRFASWSSIAEMDDETAATKIRADRIHILIDLSGHTAHNRLPLLAWKPAPVQVTWLGYFATTGVPGIDYLLADRVSVPESRSEQFTETVWYLPDCRFCFSPPTDAKRLRPAPLPALRNGFITFGCFQNLLKLNDSVLEAWGRIFRELPQARLRIQNRSMSFATAQARLRERLTRAGIASDRVTMAGQSARREYLLAHSDVDIVLDTFPYTGATTTCEALWMGVPTLTLSGDTIVSRQGTSLLVSAGQSDWIAGNESDYVIRATTLGSDIERLAKLRASLRETVLASPLFDAPRFARHLEEALRGMWKQKTDNGELRSRA